MDVFFLILEYAGIVAFAVSGAMVAIDKEADFIGVIILALVTSFGGGVMRDLFLGITPPSFFTEYTIQVIVVVAVAIAVFIAAATLKKRYVENERRIGAINNVVDALGLGIFSVYGTAIAIEAGHGEPFIAIIIGVIAAVGGGLIRDLILRDIPFIIKERIYALASLAGAFCYYLLFAVVGVDAVWATFIGVMLTFALRIFATLFKWNMPKAIVFSKLTDESISESSNESEQP